MRSTSRPARRALLPFLAGALLAGAGLAAEGAPDAPPVLSMSALEISPAGVLFIGDSKAGAVVAVELGERPRREHPERFRVADLEKRLAAALGTEPGAVTVHDLAVDPRSAEMYLAVSRDRGEWSSGWLLPNDIADARILLRIDAEGALEEVDLAALRTTRAALPNPVAAEKEHPWKPGVSLRADTITDLVFHDGAVWVAGLSNEEFASALWRIPVPFGGKAAATTVEVFHGAHGEYETQAPVRTFLPYRLGDADRMLAAYLCTPFVVFDTADLVDGAHVKGRTVSEFGSGNYPLDMVLVRREGKDRIVIANSNLPFLVIDPEKLAAWEGSLTTEPEEYASGFPAEYRSGTGVQQLAILDDARLVAIQRQPSGSLDLVSLDVRRF